MISKAVSPGQIITFYSYKGGTGRSMALANVACLLAQKQPPDEDVLMIDWDLEAPGLHQFFLGQFENKKDKSNGVPGNQLGLIDLFCEMKVRLGHKDFESDIPVSFFDDLKISKYIAELGIPSLKLMTAGRFDEGLYSSRVNAFDWEELFNDHPSLISQFANYLRKKYRFILIDSRTGYTDISGICTSLMPEKLAVVFTPNRQSLIGVEELIRNATEYRKQSDDLRPLIIFPLASRIENAEGELQKAWRFGVPGDEKIIGYQPLFENSMKNIYKLPVCDLTNYFDEIQIQYKPFYSYGEEIAVLSERTEDRLSIAKSYEKCTELLVGLQNPWEYLGQEKLQLQKGALEESIVLTRQLKVFLAHESVDKPAVRELYQRLALEKWIDPWFDEVKLSPGQNWDLEIEKAIESADVVIVCLSNNSINKKGYVQKELRFALDIALTKPEQSIFIIPVRLENCEIPRRLRIWHSIDYFQKDQRDRAYDSLRESLEKRANALTIAPVEREQPAKVFISYSHKDELFKDELVTMLRGLQHRGVVESWLDRQIEPGSEWFDMIIEAMEECEVAVLLVSSDFIASRFIQEVELYRLLQRRITEGMRIVPIIIRPCLWQSEPVMRDLQALPKDGKPVISFSRENGDRDQVWADISKSIESILKYV